MPEAILLENGVTFPGVWRGSHSEAPLGEAVFNTSMCGYQEILTDPSYAGQIVTMTYPQIGNYGVNSNDVESSKIHVRGFIVRELSEIHSNFTSEKPLEKYLDENGIACMTEVDTRALTKVLRNHGSMKCTFLRDGEDPEKALAKFKTFDYGSVDFSRQVTDDQKSEDYCNSEGPARSKVAVLDFGVKSNILRILSTFCDFEIFSCEKFLNLESLEAFDGFFLSNGPGDPESVQGAKEAIQKILTTEKPVFGICLGHQLLCQALGGKTYKLKFGHHGANHPVKNLQTGRVEISSQNHGYAVDAESFENDTIIHTHVNLNDGSLAGIKVKEKPVYSIQYHPEAAPGPHDSRYLFNQFKEDLQRGGSLA